MITVDPDSPVPLIEQLTRALRAAIAAGHIRPGSELPPVRQLANDLDINLNTVARAYRLLQDRGLVQSARGRGTRVCAVVETPAVPKRLAMRRLTASIGDALADARLTGLGAADVQAVLNAQFDALWGADAQRRA
jgi:DNA-binding transcriptional regulator YhcF (GntR family)